MVKLIGIPENNFLCIFSLILMYFQPQVCNSLIPRGAYFLLPLESKQEATTG